MDILIGTFGKALASAGAYAIVAPPVREYLVNTARSLIFTTALPPVTVWWTIHVLRKALKAVDRRTQLNECIRVFRQALGCTGPGSHIVPLVVGEDSAARQLVTTAARVWLLGPAYPTADCTGRDRAATILVRGEHGPG